MTDEELAQIRGRFDAHYEALDRHDHDKICLSMQARCEVGTGELMDAALEDTEALLAEVERLRLLTRTTILGGRTKKPPKSSGDE